MRSPRTVLAFAGLLVLAGLALVLFDDTTINSYSFGGGSGDVDAPYSSSISISFDRAWRVTQQATIGYALMWLGTLLAAGVAGFHIAARRSAAA
jgi:hypothetical protein